MDTKSFVVGDRVILLQPYLGLPTGASGTIVRHYDHTPDLYRVRFETPLARDYPIHRSNLANDNSART